MTTANPDVCTVFCDSQRISSAHEKFPDVASRNKKSPAIQPGFAEQACPSKDYQFGSRSGVAVILWMLRSAPSYSSSLSRRKPMVAFSVP